MKYRNSVNYKLKFSKGNKNKSPENKDNNFNKQVSKKILLKTLERNLRKNSEFIINLNNTFRKYELNLHQKDEKISRNLFNISANKFFNMKNKIRKSQQLIYKYDNQYGYNNENHFNKINIKKNNSNKLLKSKENTKDNNSLSISYTSKNNEEDNHIIYYISNNSKKDIKEELKSDNEFKHYSLYIDEKNNEKKFKKIIIDKNKVMERMRKIDKLAKLFNEIDILEKKEIIDNNKCFKLDKKPNNYLFFHKNKNINKSKINSARNIFKLKKRKIQFLSEEKFTNSNINNNSNTFLIKKNENNKNNSCERKKSIPKLLINYSKGKTNLNNISDLNSENFSFISSMPTSDKNRKEFNKSSSCLSVKLKKNKNSLKYKLIKFNKIKNYNSNPTLNHKQKEIKLIIDKTIDEGNKIKKIINKNYSLHKISKSKTEFFKLLNDEQLDLEKIRKDLKLKNSNGINGSINEIQLMEKNVKNMEKYISKKEINIIKSIVKKMVKDDLLLNKRLIYNVGLANRTERKRYIDLYNKLKYPNLKKKKNKYIY